MPSLKHLPDHSLTAQATLVFLPKLGITTLTHRDEHPAVSRRNGDDRDSPSLSTRRHT